MKCCNHLQENHNPNFNRCLHVYTPLELTDEITLPFFKFISYFFIFNKRIQIMNEAMTQSEGRDLWHIPTHQLYLRRICIQLF